MISYLKLKKKWKQDKIQKKEDGNAEGDRECERAQTEGMTYILVMGTIQNANVIILSINHFLLYDVLS
ncbi:MAG: hypothetical protein CMB97_03990 [Flavobacteriaceae bacterium]|nr:hypothetical protein [Flavobacteriaceae bacterium]